MNPTVANSFSTAAYRFGHTLLVGNFKRLNDQYREMQDIDLSEVRMTLQPAAAAHLWTELKRASFEKELQLHSAVVL